LERFSRLVVIASLLAAGVVHAWLASGRPWLATAIAVAFGVGVLLGRFAPTAGISGALATTYVAPALQFLAFGVSDYHTTAIWLAPLAGLALTQTSWTAWHIPTPWRFLFAGWALVIALSWPIVAGREIDFSLLAARTYDTTSGAYAAPPRLAAAWIAIVALSQLTGILWFDLLWARFGSDRRALERHVVVPMIVSACAGALAGIYQSVFDLQWMNLPVWSSIGRAGALMLDANTAAMTAAMWAPVALALALRSRGWIWVGVLAYVVLAASLWGTGSRTGLLAMSAGTAGFVVAAGDRAGWSRARIFTIGVMSGALLVLAALTIAPRMPFGSPLRRAFDRLPRLEAEDIRRFGDELWMRFGYAKAAASMTAEHPITGVGIGAFHVVAPDYLYRDGRLHPVPDNAQNWWRHQIAELGVLGAAPCLVLSVLAIGALWRGLNTREPVAVVVSAVLAGVGVAGLLGVPTQHPATWIAFVTLLFWLVSMFRQPAPDRPATGTDWRWMIAFGIAIVVAFGDTASALRDLRVPVRAARSRLPFGYGVTGAEGLSEFGEFRWAASRAVTVMPIGGPWLQLTIWAPHPDVDTRPVRYRVAVDGRDVIAVEVTDRAPRSYFLQMPGNQHVVMIELQASRDLHRDRALQIATAWQPSVPAGTPDDRVIRR
jgi:hypothetical protein